MKKHILFSLLFLGLCSIQLPALAGGDGATEEEYNINCNGDTGECDWDVALKDPLKNGGKTVKYKTPEKTYKNATDAMGDTQYAKQAGLGDSKVE